MATVLTLQACFIPDIVHIIKNGLDSGEGGAFTRLTPDFETAQHLLVAGVHTGRVFGTVLLDDNLDVIGFMLCTKGRHWLFGDDIANEELLYILPAHRGGTHALRMIKYCIQLAKMAECTMFTAGSSLQYNTEGVQALYQLAGFKTIGMKFNLDL